MTNAIEEVRKWFAEDLRAAASVASRAVIDAFALVPRERFIGPPPWRVGTRLMRMGARPFTYQTFEDDNPRVLYHDVVVALDEGNEINNGQPSLWARVFDELNPQPVERILHIGCGSGCYSAILAQITRTNGSIVAVDINAALVERARSALSLWPNVMASCGDGAGPAAFSCDAIVVCAGLTHPLAAWLEGLKPNGRLVFPLTVDGALSRSGSGAILHVSRRSTDAFAARFLCPAGFIHFEGGRDKVANERLTESFRKRPHDAANVRSSRREFHATDESCWLHGDGYCLSLREP